jgi:hypothetical protein
MKTLFLKLTTDPESEKVVERTKYRVLCEKCAILEYVSWVHLHYNNHTQPYSQMNSYRENNESKISLQAVRHAVPV